MELGLMLKFVTRLFFSYWTKGDIAIISLKNWALSLMNACAQLAFIIVIVKAINAYVGVLQFYWLPSLIIEHKELGSG